MTVLINGASVPSSITADRFAMNQSMVVVQARNGTVLHVYANVNESTEAINFKRSLASLLNSYTGVRTDVIIPSNAYDYVNIMDLIISSNVGHGNGNGNGLMVDESDVVGNYRARYTLQPFAGYGAMSSTGYYITRSKHDFDHYHPAAQTRVRIPDRAISDAASCVGDGSNDDDTQEVTIDRMDNCNTAITYGLINARQCY
jgi:hypothetical protein